MRTLYKGEIPSQKPKKIFKQPNNTHQPLSSNLLPFCYFHTDNRIVKFCQCNECTLPLCRECQPIHLQEHAKNYSSPDIQDYLVVRENAISEIQKRISTFENKTERNLQILQKEKKRIEALIGEHFRNLMERASVKQETKGIINSLDEKLEKIRRGSIKALIQYCSGQGEEEMELEAPVRIQIVRNDQALIAWLKSSIAEIRRPNNEQNFNRQKHPDSHPKPTYTPHPPQHVSTHVPIVTKPLGQNKLSTQTNLPQFSQTQPNFYQQKPKVIFDATPPIVSARRQQQPLTIKVENQSRSSSPKMPSVQIWKSKNVLRNSCEIPSPIQELNKIDVENQIHARTQEAFYQQQSKSQEKFNQTFTSGDRRPTSALQNRTGSQINIHNPGNQNYTHNPYPPRRVAQEYQTATINHGDSRSPPPTQFNHQSHQKISPSNFQISNRNIVNRPPSNIQIQKVFQPPPAVTQFQPSPSLSNLDRRVLTPQQLQSAIVRRKPTLTIESRPTSHDHRPSLFALAADQQRNNNAMRYIQNIPQTESRPQSPPKDFYKAESYFQSEKNTVDPYPSSYAQENAGYRIKVSEPPIHSNSNGFSSVNEANQLRIEDLSVPKF